MSESSKNWVFTLNNPNSIELPEWDTIKYLSWQKEKGEAGTEHIQGYVELSKKSRLSALKKWLPTAHFEKRKGSREQARNYTRKEDSRIDGPWEKGEWRQEQGIRTDLIKVQEMIKEGSSMESIADEHFGTWCKFKSAFQEYMNMKTIPRNWPMRVIVLWGETGTGKSRWCFENFPNAYMKPRGEWWNKYKGEETVILDDFYGWISFDEMLRLMDRYPMLVPIKGGYTQFTSKTIVITSNKPWDKWYKSDRITEEMKDAFRRRITEIHHFNKSNMKRLFPQSENFNDSETLSFNTNTNTRFSSPESPCAQKIRDLYYELEKNPTQPLPPPSK